MPHVGQKVVIGLRHGEIAELGDARAALVRWDNTGLASWESFESLAPAEAEAAVEPVTNEQLFATMVKLGRRLVNNFEPEPADLHAGCNANVDRLERNAQDLEAKLRKALAKLDVVRRPVDRVALAKVLFIERMDAVYGMHPNIGATTWEKLSPDCQEQWLAVADRAIQQILATDM